MIEGNLVETFWEPMTIDLVQRQKKKNLRTKEKGNPMS